MSDVQLHRVGSGEVEVQGSPSLQIAGYVLCKCGGYELPATFFQCGGVCFSCFTKGVVAKIHEIEVYNRNQRLTMPVPSTWPKKRKKNRNRPRLADHARRAARKRTCAAMPDLYELFYAEERMKRGLPPTAKRVEGYLARVVETYEATLVYSPPTNQGVGANGVS